SRLRKRSAVKTIATRIATTTRGTRFTPRVLTLLSKLGACSLDAALGLPGLVNPERVRRLVRTAAREPADERQPRMARRLGHRRLTDEAREVGDQARAFALVGHSRPSAAVGLPIFLGPGHVRGKA